MKLLGIVLILLGIAMIATGGFSFKTKEKVVDTDVVDISRTKNKTVTWPWFAGGIAVVGGVVMLLAANRKK